VRIFDYEEVEEAAVVVADVDEASSLGTIEGAAMMTVREHVDVRPFWSVATWSMLSVAAWLVSMPIGLIGGPLRWVLMPQRLYLSTICTKFWSAPLSAVRALASCAALSFEEAIELSVFQIA